MVAVADISISYAHRAAAELAARLSADLSAASTIGRWVLRYAPELNKRIRHEIRPRVINVDSHPAYPQGIDELSTSARTWEHPASARGGAAPADATRR